MSAIGRSNASRSRGLVLDLLGPDEHVAHPGERRRRLDAARPGELKGRVDPQRAVEMEVELRLGHREGQGPQAAGVERRHAPDGRPGAFLRLAPDGVRSTGTPGPLRSTTVSRLRSLVAGLIWVALVVVIAAGIAGLVATMNRAPGTPDREELTWVGDREAEPALDDATVRLQALSDSVDALSVDRARRPRPRHVRRPRRAPAGDHRRHPPARRGRRRDDGPAGLDGLGPPRRRGLAAAGLRRRATVATTSWPRRRP